MKGLARKRGASAVLFVQEGGLLLVKPTYKDTWSLPGGVWDALESPAAAAVRECREELGLEVILERLLVVDWMPETLPDTFDSLQFLFLGRRLEEAELAALRLPEAELSDWRIVAVEEAMELLSEGQARRVKAGLLAMDSGRVYAEAGELVL